MIDGVLVVDKPPGMTSHDVVARIRRAYQTRKVGHAGTLDPMATGVLVLGLGRATRLLGHLALDDKDYLATIRLGEATRTDDADGEVAESPGAQGVELEAVVRAAMQFKGALLQRPSSVSAVKVSGRRAYALARQGDPVDLPARPVTVSRFDVSAAQPGIGRSRATVLDVDVAVTCSSGTYVRALARDLGEALGTGGHLTSLRRTRVGPFALDAAVVDIDRPAALIPITAAVTMTLPTVHVALEDEERVRHGVRIPVPGGAPADGGVFGVISGAGETLALAVAEPTGLRYRAVLAGT